MRIEMLAAVLILALSIGCASAGGKLTLTEDAIHDSLAKVDDQVRATCTGPNAELLKPTCEEARQALIPALEAGAAFNRAVAQQKVSNMADLLTAVGRLIEIIKKFPEGETAAWVQELARSLAAAYQSLGGH